MFDFDSAFPEVKGYNRGYIIKNVVRDNRKVFIQGEYVYVNEKNEGFKVALNKNGYGVGEHVCALIPQVDFALIALSKFSVSMRTNVKDILADYGLGDFSGLEKTLNNLMDVKNPKTLPIEFSGNINVVTRGTTEGRPIELSIGSHHYFQEVTRYHQNVYIDISSPLVDANIKLHAASRGMAQNVVHTLAEHIKIKIEELEEIPHEK